MDIAEILTRLQDATPQELNAALAAIRTASAQYTGTPTAESAAAVTELATQARQVAGELTRRTELANQQSAQLAELQALTEVPEQAPEVVPDPQAEPPAADPAPAEEPPAADPPAADPQAVTAAGRRLGGTQNPGTPAPIARPRATATTAALPGSGLEGEQQLDRRGIAEAFARRNDQLRRAPSNTRADMIRIVTRYPEERHLAANADAFSNIEKVERVQSDVLSRTAEQNALTAAGLCAPLEVLYDIDVLGDEDRPVRDALTRFGADRGGITYRPALDGVTQTGGIGTWTKANDVADPLVPKTCVEIACPGILTAEVEATYMCLTFSNMSSRFDPEQMDASIRAQRIAHARFSENKLLTQLRAGSKPLYTTRLLGAVRDILVTLDKVTAYYRNVHRLAQSASLRAILPAWAQNLMRADMVRQMVGDGPTVLAIADAMINEWFRVRNVNITWHLDGIAGRTLSTPEPDVVIPNQFYALAAAQAEVPGFPDVVEMLLFQEGSWLYLDGGELNLGLVRDSTLNADNRFQTFSESFEIAANRGIESMSINMAVQPTGQSAATVTTASAAD